MEQIGNVIEGVLTNPLVESIFIIIISYLIYRGISNILLGKNRKIKLSIGARSKTYLRLVQSALRYVFAIITALIVLQVNHIDVSSILAGVGIAGAVVGVGSQDTIKDIVRGFTLVSDDYFSVGDIIKYHDIEGRVIVVGLKTTKIQDIKNENIISIANRDIDEAQVVAPCIYVNIPLSYELSAKEALALMDEICQEATKSELIADCISHGVNVLEDSSVSYLLRASCKAADKLPATRFVNQTAYNVLEKHHLSFPYPQLDIHKKA